MSDVLGLKLNIPYLILKCRSGQFILRQISPGARAAVPYIARKDDAIRSDLLALASGLHAQSGVS